MNSSKAWGDISSIPPLDPDSLLILSFTGNMVRMSEEGIRACGTGDGRKRLLPKGMKVCTSSHESREECDRDAELVRQLQVPTQSWFSIPWTSVILR